MFGNSAGDRPALNPASSADWPLIALRCFDLSRSEVGLTAGYKNVCCSRLVVVSTPLNRYQVVNIVVVLVLYIPYGTDCFRTVFIVGCFSFFVYGSSELDYLKF